jgi:hypothetical protein
MKNQNDNQTSSDLQTFMEVNNIDTLEELLLISDEELIAMPGFSWHLLKEILLLRNI